MAVMMKQAAEVVRSGIYFKDKSPLMCIRTAGVINHGIFDIEYTDAVEIVRFNEENKRRKDQDQFDKALAKVVSMLTPEQLLGVDGAYEIYCEEFNNQTLDVIEAYNTDPGQNNLELKYTTREILEIVVNDLEDLRDWAEEKADSEDQRRHINRVGDTITLAKGYLDNMSHILGGMVQ